MLLWLISGPQKKGFSTCNAIAVLISNPMKGGGVSTTVFTTNTLRGEGLVSQVS